MPEVYDWTGRSKQSLESPEEEVCRLEAFASEELILTEALHCFEKIFS